MISAATHFISTRLSALPIKSRIKCLRIYTKKCNRVKTLTLNIDPTRTIILVTHLNEDFFNFHYMAKAKGIAILTTGMFL